METVQPGRPLIRVEKSAQTDLILTALCKADKPAAKCCIRFRADSLALDFMTCGIASHLSPQQCLRQIGIIGCDSLTTWAELRNFAFQRFLLFLQERHERLCGSRA